LESPPCLDVPLCNVELPIQQQQQSDRLLSLNPLADDAGHVFFIASHFNLKRSSVVAIFGW